MNFSRRKFLIASGAVGAIPLLMNSHSGNRPASNLVSEMQEEIKEISKQWKLSEQLSPQEYLTKRNVNSCLNTDKDKVANIISNDFIIDEIITVKGMLLSKTEAAIMIQTMGTV
jgi:hypothetical protein